MAKPTKTDTERREAFANVAAGTVKAAQEIKTDLALDETSYLRIASWAVHDPRARFAYAALDEAGKAAATVLSRSDYVSDAPTSDDPALDRILIRGPLEERLFWRRKLIEALADVIGFEQSNEQSYYRHYFLVKDLRKLLSAQRDLVEFWSCKSRNYQHQLDDVILRLDDLHDRGLDLTRAWYVAKPERATQKLRPASFATRLHFAVEHSGPEERGILGFSYVPGYGALSGEVHFDGAEPGAEWTIDAYESAGEVVLLTAMYLVRAVQRLTGLRGGTQAERLAGLLNQNPSPAAVASDATGGRAVRGQLVLAYGHLGEVLDVATSKYGYESYLVRYVGNPPLPDVPEDWHVAQQIHFLADLDYLAQRMLVGPGLSDSERDLISSVPAPERRQILFDVIQRLWVDGNHEFIYGLAAAERRTRDMTQVL